MSDRGLEYAGRLRRTGNWSAWPLFCLAAIAALAVIDAAWAENLPEALVKAYQSTPQLNADRARQRGADENVPQALAGYRPQIIASLSAGLQAVRNGLPDNTIQGATLRPWTIGVTVSQVLFNGFKTANSVRVAEFQVLSGREALRNTGQGCSHYDRWRRLHGKRQRQQRVECGQRPLAGGAHIRTQHDPKWIRHRGTFRAVSGSRQQ